MASSLLETATPGAVEWAPKRSALDQRAFDCGRVGPYCLGPQIRCGPFGPVHLALGAQFEVVLEIERIETSSFEVDHVSPSELDWPAPEAASGWGPRDRTDCLSARLLERFNHCVGLSHPHVAQILGAGLSDGVPYILRAHTLGRTLGDLSMDGLSPPADVAVGILYSAAEGIRFLENAGPRPGACAVGGVGADTVMVGWDGSVRILGAGLALLRDDRVGSDFDGLRALARQLNPDVGDLLEEATDAQDAATRLRRWRREACAERQSASGAWMRRVDAEGCAAFRQFFSLEPLH